ncbi:MAG: GWxTD domain-containing protein [Candidatus Korobacteraceae bacterium]
MAALLTLPALAQDTKPAGEPSAGGEGKAAQPQSKEAAKKAKEVQRRRLQELQGPYKKWLNEDVRWIITPEEEAAFKQLSTDEERDQFIEQFWRRRDPTPDTEENEFKDEHYRRIAYANEHFSAGIQGWRTDRGRIYIVWGPPDETDSHPSGGTYQRDISEGGGTTSTYPFERWRYRYLEGIGSEVVIEFVDACSCNDYHISVDPNEKDALLHTPGAGLTMYEQMGLSSQVDRVTGGNRNNPFASQSDQFDRLERLAKLNAPPPIKFKDLQEDVTHRVTYNLVPFDVRVDYVRITSDTVLAPITIQVKNKDLTFVSKQGIQRGSLNIFGRASTLSGRVATSFEDTVSIDVPTELLPKSLEQVSLYWKALTLRPGRYRIDVVVKDVNGDRKGSWSKGVMIPEYSEDKLASSSLIVADLLEKVGYKDAGSGRFVIGNTRIHPRVEPANGQPVSFKRNQEMHLWMQVYNLAADEKTKRPSATIQYQVINLQTNQPVQQLVEKTEDMGHVGEQLTLQKAIALGKLDPGLYRLQVKVDDNVSKQSISPSMRFVVE